MANNDSWIPHFVDVLGGVRVSFLSTLFLEPAKQRLFKPEIKFNFPINADTSLQDNLTTPFITLSMDPKDPKRPLESGECISSIRCRLLNLSKTFIAEGCRIFLTSISTRDNPHQPWRSTEYKEYNQIAWSKKQFEYEEMDIYPSTSRLFEILSLNHNRLRITVRIQQNHFSFQHLFHSPMPPDKGWKFQLLAVGKNTKPTYFDFILEYVSFNERGMSRLIFQANGCRLNLDKLVMRNYLDPVAWEALRVRGELPSIEFQKTG